MSCMNATVYAVRRRSARESLLQGFQRTDELLVIAPARHGALVNLLPYLPGAGSGHLPPVRMELQYPCVPFQSDEIEHFARPGLMLGHQCFVRHVKNESRR